MHDGTLGHVIAYAYNSYLVTSKGVLATQGTCMEMIDKLEFGLENRAATSATKVVQD